MRKPSEDSPQAPGIRPRRVSERVLRGASDHELDLEDARTDQLKSFDDTTHTDLPALQKPASEWSSIVQERSENTQRREAAALVPDVGSLPPPKAPLQEASEDGLIPSGELDRKLLDMDVLLRYGHLAQVTGELEALRLLYPHDLLLLRRISEFYLERRQTESACDTLFALATGLFERRNVEGMRAALTQIRAIDPDNERARRLLSLLERRPG
jgi:hypothetical protein